MICRIYHFQSNLSLKTTTTSELWMWKRLTSITKRKTTCPALSGFPITTVNSPTQIFLILRWIWTLEDQNLCLGTSLVVQWLTLPASTVKGTGLIPGQGTKILRAALLGKKKKLNARNKHVQKTPQNPHKTLLPLEAQRKCRYWSYKPTFLFKLFSTFLFMLVSLFCFIFNYEGNG